MKEGYMCNHCGQSVKCYESEMKRCGLVAITCKKTASDKFENFTNTPRKFYCEDCMKHIAEELLRGI